MATFHTRPVSRRGFLRSTAGGLTAAALAGPLLSACSSSPGSDGKAGNTVKLPTQVPFKGVTPDLPGDPAKGINDAYLRYPAVDKRVKTVEGAVGSGGVLSAFVTSFSPPPAAMGGNAYWQAINQALGVQFKPTLVPQEFQAKLAAMLAGGDVPDLVTMYLDDAASVRRFDAVAQSKFADLTPHLSGDAVKEYPNLARLAPDAWPSTLFDGRIYATPTLRIPTSTVTYTRNDVIEKLGGNPQPKTAADFEQLCKTLSDPAKKRWAMRNGGSGWLLGGLFYPMFGVPNGWRLSDSGSLTNRIETDEWLAAIAYVAGLWKKGYWHPDSPTDTGPEVDPLFQNGSVPIMQDSFVRYTVRSDAALVPDIMAPFGHDGGKAVAYVGSVGDFVTFVKKGSEDKVKECLRVLDWLNAPFGSTENFLRTYGAEGKDYTLENGQPTLTDEGQAETYSLCLRFIGGGPDVLYATNGNTSVVKKMHAYQTAVSDIRLKDPTAGVYSEVAATSGAITQQVSDTVTDVILGRKPQSALKDSVAKWKNAGGDKVRADYEKSIAETKEQTSGTR